MASDWGILIPSNTERIGDSEMPLIRIVSTGTFKIETSGIRHVKTVQGRVNRSENALHVDANFQESPNREV